MSSSNSINYSIRVNKSIERKIMSEGISNVMSKFDITYRYIGFGSLWFVDFIHFHKTLKIHDMVSIEKDRIVYDRADYNKPFSCIDLVSGESAAVLQDILSKSDMPSIIWLDYDASVYQCSSYQADVDNIVNYSKNGSLLIVTMNVGVSHGVREMKRQAAATTEPESWVPKVTGMLRNTFGLVNMESVSGRMLTNQDRFPTLVKPYFEETIQNSIYNSGNHKVCTKIFDMAYSDGAEMLTQGFILLDSDKNADIDKLTPFKSPYFLNEETFRISAPILTSREKYEIDKRLPSNDIEAFIREAGTTDHENETYLAKEKLGFPLSVKTLRGYSQLYRYYPTFSEIFTG
ncbi:O-methyltransferase [Dawidia soli]|uniref:Uncharacterized protein n=1 Tax=Dawidia soli TaxID=2782352 RepID=A0AAP2DAF1_9BACT|nr:O-methyltransferase [Dawidia soli]MBT1688104.1 hypothetical protein [Dawidia soli]